jgi:small subunit ribosomal protein S9
MDNGGQAVGEEPMQAVLEQAEQVAVQAEPKAAGAKFGFYWGTGRRKTAVARVRIKPGSGAFEVNGKPVDKFFSEMRDRNSATEALKVTEQMGKWDVFANVHGGGFHGQADAIKLGLARALKLANAEFEQVLRDHGLLSRDERKKERKKFGRRGARRGFQFSKR